MAKLELNRSTGFTISELRKLDDAAILDLLGYVNKVNAFKEHLAEADNLSGKARTIFEEKLDKMLTPNVYPDELGWMIKDSKRQAKPSSGKEEMANCCCDSVLD